MTNHILISLTAFDVNASSSPYSVGIPALTSVSGFVDAIRHNAKLVERPIPIIGFAFGYNDPRLVGHEQKYKVLLNVPRNTIDPGDMAPPPSPRISARFHVILQTEGMNVNEQIATIRKITSLPSLRFCGGSIDTTARVQVRQIERPDDLWNGYYIQDATHELALPAKSRPELTPLERMVVLCYQKGEDGLRRYPNTLGYLSLEEAPTLRETRYGERPHVYAEAAVGIVKEVHASAIQANRNSFSEAILPFIFYKTFDHRGSMYLKHKPNHP